MASGAAFGFAPENLKPTVDREFADGVNRFVISSSDHQPLERPGPGTTLGPFGVWFNRHETWAEQAGPWVDYLSRSSYLLQQGRFVADVLWYYGQDSNITALYANALPPVPSGYAFDFANTDALTRLSVTPDGSLTTASGMRYRLLALDARAQIMSIDVLERLAALVQAGATVLGAKPIASPSLADDPAHFNALAGAVWGAGDEPAGVRGGHRYGQGRVMWGVSLTDALPAIAAEPDFDYARAADAEVPVVFVHRTAPEAEIYWLSNRTDQPVSLDARFRVSGRAAEFWHADSGHQEAASYRIEGSHTLVPLELDAHEALFVVFRAPTAGRW